MATLDRSMITISPSEAEIQKIVDATGMGHVQARNHLIGKHYLLQMAERRETERRRTVGEFAMGFSQVNSTF